LFKFPLTQRIWLPALFVAGLLVSFGRGYAQSTDPTAQSDDEDIALVKQQSSLSPLMPKDVTALREVRYVAGSKSQSQKLDLFVPASSARKPVPVIICIHGGAWDHGDKVFVPVVPFLQHGFAVASINYRLSPEAPFPAQIDDCKAAVRWIRAHAAAYGLDKDHFGACGGSAGAHLAALLGTTCGDPAFGGGAPETVSSCIQAVCDMSGPTDLTKYPSSELLSLTSAYPTVVIAAVTKLLGGPVESNLETAKRASPLFYAERKTPPFLIIHGDQDHLVPLSDSERFYDALKKNGNDATLLVIHATHGGREFMQPDLLAKIISFFDKHLRD